MEIRYCITSDDSFDSNCNFPLFISILLDCGKIDTDMRYIQLIVIDSRFLSWTIAEFNNDVIIVVFSRMDKEDIILRSEARFISKPA